MKEVYTLKTNKSVLNWTFPRHWGSSFNLGLNLTKVVLRVQLSTLNKKETHWKVQKTKPSEYQHNDKEKYDLVPAFIPENVHSYEYAS